MAKFKLSKNADGTYTVTVGRYRESVSGDKSPVQLLEAVRYALVAGGISVDEDAIWDRIRALQDG